MGYFLSKAPGYEMPLLTAIVRAALTCDDVFYMGLGGPCIELSWKQCCHRLSKLGFVHPEHIAEDLKEGIPIESLPEWIPVPSSEDGIVKVVMNRIYPITEEGYAYCAAIKLFCGVT